MRQHPVRFSASLVSFAAILAVPAAGPNVLRSHDVPGMGARTGTKFAVAVDFVGDVDGDGVDDYAVGAPLAAPGGEAYVYSGLSGALLHTFVGEGADHQFGTDVSPAGDVDGDGRADLLVVAPQAPASHYFFDDGRVYLYSGATGALIHFIDGKNDENLFRAIGIGDANGASVPDAAAVSRVGGDVYAYSGATGAWLWTLERHGTSAFKGPIAPLDDVDGDGVPDLSATGYQLFTSSYAGVFSGVDGTEIRRHSTSFGDLGLASIHDLDGDGERDLAVGVPQALSGAGAVYVYS